MTPVFCTWKCFKYGISSVESVICGSGNSAASSGVISGIEVTATSGEDTYPEPGLTRHGLVNPPVSGST